MRKLIYFLIAVLTLSTGYSQLAGTHNYLDTSYVAPKNLSQQNDFLNNNSNFAAMPRHMLQVGIFTGLPRVNGDCPNTNSWSFGASARKALGYVLSARASVAYYNMSGQDYQPNPNINNHPFIQQQYQSSPFGYIHSYNTKAVAVGLEGVISFNNIMFHRRQSRWNAYSFAGYTAFAYKTKLDAVNEKGEAYNLSTVNFKASKGKVRSALNRLMDGKYETEALTHPQMSNVGGLSLAHSLSFGLGLEFRVARKASVSLEYKQIYTADDYVDGWFLKSGNLINPVSTSHYDNVGFLSVGVNFNIGNLKKRIPPLWWMNPLEFGYSELNNPKSMKIPKLVFPDYPQVEVMMQNKTGSALAAKQKIADSLLSFITNTAYKKLPKNEIKEYIKTDKARYPSYPEAAFNKKIDEVIEFRKAFINHLKEKYEE